MHDPMTVAFTVRNRLVRPKTWTDGHKYWPHLITIWHVDPERRGDDDSCDWFGRRRRLNSREEALDSALGNLTHVLGNAPFYPDPRLYGHEPHAYQVIDAPMKELRVAANEWRRGGRRLHPRWHVWHWKVQLHPVQHFKRWAFSRCRECGAGFSWGYAPVSGSWYGRGPSWFRNAEHVYHSECHNEVIRRAENAAAVQQAADLLGIDPLGAV